MHVAHCTSEDVGADYGQDLMERFWSNSIFKYLRVEPEDHHFLLTEPVSCTALPTQIEVSDMLPAT